MAAAFEIHPDGSAKDPVAFRDALRHDEDRMNELKKEDHAYRIVMGDDIEAFQSLLKATYKKEKPRIEARRRMRANKTIEAQRAAATVPKYCYQCIETCTTCLGRDTVELYKRMHDIGLQYGPAFRLLRNVHVPDSQN